MDHHRKPAVSPDSALASDLFDQFCAANTQKSILGIFRHLCDILHIKPTNFPQFYPKLKAKLRSWKAQALWNKFDKRASHKCYNRGKACPNTRVLVIGGGPCGVRAAIEAQLLGAKVVVVEKRDRMSRNNVLHLWPFVIQDLRALGAKKFFGKFCAGSIDHISIRQLQCILLKVALIFGVEIYEGVSFESIIPVPDDQSERTGWRALTTPADHPVSQYEFDVLIGADGRRNTLEGFRRKEFRGKLAIAITANFINRHSEAEARVEEISGVAFIFNQKFFKDLYAATGIDLENIVYYKDETHYFVMTAKKHSLLDKGVIMNDYADTAKLLAIENVDKNALEQYAREAADFSTNYRLPNLDFAVNHYGQPDVAMFDFTSMYAAENASRVIERHGHKLLMMLVGDSLLEPFWPTGSGCARGFLSSLDACWAIRSWGMGNSNPLEVLSERESIYRILGQTTPENLQRDLTSYTLDPTSRYPNLNSRCVLPIQARGLYDTDNPTAIEECIKAPSITTLDQPKKRRRRDSQVHPDTLLRWLKKQVTLYDTVHIEDMSSSFKDGMALCAIIHRYRPDLIDFHSLSSQDVSKNNQLAFDTLEREFGISPVMTGLEMDQCEVPDRLAMLSYLSQIYDTFRGEIPHFKHPKLEDFELPVEVNQTAVMNERLRNLAQMSSAHKVSLVGRLVNQNTPTRKRHSTNTPRTDTLSRKTRKRRSAASEKDKPASNVEWRDWHKTLDDIEEKRQERLKDLKEMEINRLERQRCVKEIEKNRQDRMMRKRYMRHLATQQFKKSMQMLQGNAKSESDSSPFEDYSLFVYRQTAPDFQDRVKELEMKLLYPDREARLHAELKRAAASKDEKFSGRVKEIEAKLKGTAGTEKKPKDLLRAIVNYAEDLSGSRGLFPEIFNLASVAEIKANATCGERGPENFCRLSPWTGRRGDQCGVCDGRSPDHAKRHLAAFALDGKGRWWQSPTLQAGSQYEWITLTIDLKQEYQVAYVIVKSGISPRPGNWILERSLDGESYQAWQYYAVSDDECWSKFGVRPAPPYPNYQSDTEVLCTSFFSKIKPFEGGEIHTSLVRGRPGVNSTSPELANFTRARYIRLRLQKIRLIADRPHLDRSVANRFFYSIKDITIGGQCICSGHASKCRHDDVTGEALCACEHNTCGNHCDTCCPLYNQEAFHLGTSFDGAPCQQCQCFGHATSCHYDPEVAAARLSLNMHDLFSGGGVCNNCSKHTTGVNCEQCESGWYRPLGVRPDAAEPCLPCDCHRLGSTGSCVRDDSQSHQGKPAGTCDCVVGYTGPKCDRCAPGFHNFPNCEPCPCDADGSKPSVDCGDNCVCKKNVEGEHCNQCKQGYFFLDRDNPDGCTECYCSGVSQSCVEASGYRLHEVNTLSNWLVSDITVSRTVLPSIDPDTKLLVIGNYELPGVESYYWLAPEAYRGNKLTSYGATLTFRVSWVIMRGDSSGKPTSGPDVILVGSNGFRIGYGESWYHQNNMSVTIQLVETGWYQMRDDDRAGRGITRAELLNVLSDIKYLLVRAKFHTDQVEGSLVSVCFETGVEGTSGTAVGYLEECTCPAGYKGLSCESCDFGYARILPDSSAPHQQAVCSKCNCYGHAASCDSTTGQCAECEHHTIGPNCERCAHGYFGDAQQETPNDCKRCACPLEDPENNFSPSCETDGHGDDYVCTQCPQGYQGRHCEECSPGYFGNPLEKGSKCKQCDCNEGPCDPVTGQCLSCRGNTEGWRCERCRPAHYGDPKMFDCRSCDCSNVGSLRTDECDSDSGQCECRDKYTGRSCDRCQAGLGNITAGCISCNCDSIGSTSSLCDPITGQCSCHPGVGNSKCQECLPLHYGFSNNGCNKCQCSELGSLRQECDIDTGQCHCIDHVIGRACDTCQEGWWGLIAGPGIPLCRPCNCDSVGAINSSCDSATGQCICKPGVGGISCDSCMELFYGFSVYGCSECEECDKKGHICDPDTGRCVCPPFTQGDDCETCQPNTWGYQAKKGCKPCNCDTRGATTGQCDEQAGRCNCRPGYSGEQCNTCARGYYGFPRCRPCDCDKAGTKSQHCPQGVCVCDDVGQCPCKANVMGKHCDQCKNGTFGLHPEQPDGCIHCFCFGRTTLCSEAGLTWSQLRTTRPRTLNINYDNTTSVDTNFPVNTQEVCYINLAVPGSTGMSLNGDASRLNITNNLRIIPGDAWDVEIGVSFLFDSPVYWQLPSNFLGDKILSYGGFLRFTVETEGGTTLLPPAVLASYPLIQIQGNSRIILEHFPVLSNPSPRHEVRFHESLWRMKNNPTGKVSRDMLMIALQNIQHILIRASDSVDFTRAVLRDVTVDTAIQTPKQAPPFAHGVELCECPTQYNSTSCQDPSIGFYRYRGKETIRSTIVIQLVGESRPCNCSGRSSVCDIETGNCVNCSEDTGGNHCEKCAEGYYGNPDIEGCEPCPCPSTTRNFAVSCEVPQGRDPVCQCRQGYTGRLCDRCSYGWYGFPQRAGGFCVPCECNPYGSVSDECHEETGQCNCRPGITARDCSQCEARHILTPRGCTSCDDGCTGLLLDKLDELKHLLGKGAGHLAGGLIAPPWEKLMEIEGNVTRYEQLWKLHHLIQQRLDELPPDLEGGLQKQAQQLLNKAKKMQKNCNQQNYLAFDTKTETDNLFSEIKEMQVENQGIISQLQSYGTTDGGNVNIASALHEARILIGEVRDNDYEPSANATLDVLRFCNETLLDLQERLDDHSEIDDLKSRLDVLTDRINDFNRIISEARNETDKAKNITEQNKIILENVKKSVTMSNNLLTDTELLANESTTLVNLADVLMGETQDNFDALHMVADEIKNLSKSAEEKEGILSNLNPLYEEEYVRPAQKHADDLMKKAQEYAGLFAETKQDADFPLRASKAYQDIVDALHGAREAAKNASIAADIAYEKAYPGVGTESLVDQATVAGLDSKRLLEVAQKQRSRVESLKEDLNASIASVSTLRQLLTQAALGDNAITRKLQKLDSSEIGQDAEDILLDAMDLEENARLLQAEADAVSTDVKVKLRPQLQQLDIDGEESLNAAQEIISETRVTVSKAQELVAQITSKSRRQNIEFETWNNTVASKLEALRNKIMQARHIADGIRVSLTSHGKGGGSCVRTYQPSHLEPSTMTSIVLTYAISSQERDALLFYLPSTTTDDFIAVEMVNRKMRFVWNVGGGPGEVTHSLHIQTAGDLSNDQHWYRVEAERISNVGRLSVRPQVLPDGSPLASGTPVTNASAAGSGRLDIGPGDRVWVGGADRRPPYLQSTQPGLVGCLHRLLLDGRPIGLWDFRSQSTAGCAACIEGVEEIKDEQSYSFTGEGYTVLHYDSAAAYNKYLFSISLNFRTFDENALIFLAVGSQPERFVSLTLSQGHLVFRIGYGGDSSLEISTLNTYNTGNWTKLEASRYFDRKKKVEKGVLKVEGEVRDGAPTPPPSQDAIPDLSEAEYYVGGVPPGFKPDFPLPGSFLGCMSDIQVNQEGYNLLRGQFWGLQASCSDKPLTVVGFNGDGYLELSSHTLKKKGSFGFVFATSQHDALLMLSTFEGLAGQYEPFEDNEEITNLIEQEDRLSYYTVSLRRGQIDVRLNAGRGEVRLASTSSEYADEQFHSIAVSKTGRRLELRVDDTLHATATLPEGATVIKAPGPSGGLFFGGLPMGFNITGRTVSSVPFVGTIKDAIFNDQLLHFDWPISFSHAALGRVGPVKGSTAIIQAPSMATRAASGCRKVASYTIQSGAVKFGDSANTHVHINFRKRSILQKNYTLEIDFRTFYPNGLIFIVPGVRGKQHYIMASLRNGRLYVVLKGRKKIELTAQSVLNDGAWHHMILRKEERKMILLVDSIEPEKTKTPKKLNIGSIMYIGGLPESGLSLPDSLVSKIESFKGCMQGLKLNGHNEDLVGDKATPHRVGQCFPQVERGSYFPGDAYAIYKTRFNVGALLELELEFRTSELNGILLSVSESVGYPALSLELHNGKVIMSGDMGDRRPFHVEQGFASEFAVCDNRWHRIEAHYVDAELTLRVDHLDKKYWLSDNGHLTEAHTSSPLYIGGIPDHASSGTLQTRENFKGCIRNVVIGGERRDWTNMAALHNILLSSCPLLG